MNRPDLTAARLRLLARVGGRRLRPVRSVAAPTSRTPSVMRVALARSAPDLVELGFVLVLCLGVSFIFWPAALILFGVLGVVACERRSALAARTGHAEVQRVPERVA